jgi:hypothetical protein
MVVSLQVSGDEADLRAWVPSLPAAIELTLDRVLGGKGGGQPQKGMSHGGCFQGPRCAWTVYYTAGPGARQPQLLLPVSGTTFTRLASLGDCNLSA